MQISKNLSLRELIKSNTASRLGINNSPNEECIKNLKALGEKVFEPLREKWNKPIFISSGYRSPELNKAISVSNRSQHSKGEAIDIDMDHRNSTVTNRMIFFTLKEMEFDQLIWEFGDEENPDWVHVSYKREGNNRRQILKAIKENKKTKYKKYV